MAICTDDTPDRDSLNWLAVQYVLGELSESEASAFEERLAVDLTACEAIAEATRLTLALQLAAADRVVVRDHVAITDLSAVALSHQLELRSCSMRRASRGSWLALTGAAMAAAGLLAAISLGPAGSRQEPLAQVDRTASELVSLWRTGSLMAATVLDDADVEVDESNHEVAVPNWLFTAVSLEQLQPAGESNEDSQENGL